MNENAFTYDGTELVAVDEPRPYNCHGCYFYLLEGALVCTRPETGLPSCCAENRKDGKDRIFVPRTQSLNTGEK